MQRRPVETESFTFYYQGPEDVDYTFHGTATRYSSEDAFDLELESATADGEPVSVESVSDLFDDYISSHRELAFTLGNW